MSSRRKANRSGRASCPTRKRTRRPFKQLRKPRPILRTRVAVSAPKVEVAAPPPVVIPAPIAHVNVPAPNIQVEAPVSHVNVPAPNIQVEAPIANVTVQPEGTVSALRDTLAAYIGTQVELLTAYGGDPLNRVGVLEAVGQGTVVLRPSIGQQDQAQVIFYSLADIIGFRPGVPVPPGAAIAL